jgi:hypothetical protein
MDGSVSSGETPLEFMILAWVIGEAAVRATRRG